MMLDLLFSYVLPHKKGWIHVHGVTTTDVQQDRLDRILSLIVVWLNAPFGWPGPSKTVGWFVLVWFVGYAIVLADGHSMIDDSQYNWDGIPPPSFFFMPIKVYKWKHPTGPSLAHFNSIQRFDLISLDRSPSSFGADQNPAGPNSRSTTTLLGWCGWSDVFYVTMPPISCSGRIEPFFPFFLLLTMNFSPYSPSPDEDRGSRTKKQKQPIPGFSSYQASHPESFAEQGRLGASSSSHHSEPISGNVRVNKYETAVSIRVDIEAALCYCLGPVTGKLCGMKFRFLRHIRFIVFNIGNTKWLCQIPRMAGNKEGEHSLCICDLKQSFNFSHRLCFLPWCSYSSCSYSSLLSYHGSCSFSLRDFYFI